MKCTEFETVLNELLDSRLDLKSDIRVSAHAATCKSCKEELELYASLATLAPEETSGQPGSIETTLLTPNVSILASQSRRRWLGYAVLTSAAALFLVLGPFSKFFFSHSPTPNNVAKAEKSPLDLPGFAQKPTAEPRLNSNAEDKSARKRKNENGRRQLKDGSRQRPTTTAKKPVVPDRALGKNEAASTGSVIPADSNTPKMRSAKVAKDFWTNNALNHPIQDPFGNFQGAFPTAPVAPDLDDLGRVGESLETVWKSIQEDDYILPLVKQGALLLVRGS